MVLSEFLSFLRAELGATSAKSFHSELKKRGLECNYPTYVKIETGRLLPSPVLITQLSKALPPKWQEELILAYSRTQFPQYAYLFSSEVPLRPTKSRPGPGPSPSVSPARELTRRQVAILARSPAHYHLFLILTMARKPLPKKDLEKKFRREPFEKILSDLSDGDFLFDEESGIRMRTTEWRFPSAADDSTLQKTYRQFDEWDLAFGEQFGFETLLQKMLIRRISPRYLHLIQRQLEICLDLVRTSDELEARYNQSLVQVRVQLKSGVLPG
jgi:hypothetical protein